MTFPFTHTPSQVQAQLECEDLIANGYFIRFAHFDDDWWFVKLKHHHNGRTIVVEWKNKRCTIKENKLILKSVGESD